MELFQVDTVEAALAKLLGVSAALARVETAPLPAAVGRVLAAPLTAPFDVPGGDRSTVDGDALRAVDSAGAGESLPAFLDCLGRVEMGQVAPAAIGPGQCIYVPTGAMLPPGADAVVMVEYCEVFGSRVAVGDAVSPGRNLIWRGEDARTGQTLLPAGRRLRPADIGAAAALGYAAADVYAAPRVAVFSSGDEVIAAGSAALAPGQVYDINGPALAALAARAGWRVTQTAIVADVEEQLRNALAAARRDNDVVIISGGSSQGLKDMTARVFADIARPGLLSHGLAVRPGKPTVLARDEASQTLLAGLPGHPVSALMVMEGVLLEWWRRLSGQPAPRLLPARLSGNLPAAAGKQSWQPVRLEAAGDGYLARPVFFRSGLISALSGADGFFTLERNSEGLPDGAPVQVQLFD